MQTCQWKYEVMSLVLFFIISNILKSYYNGKYIKPSFEYGINYKLIDNISGNYNAPLIITKNVF